MVESELVEHDQAAHRFVLVRDACESVLEYRLVGEHVLNFYHTYTPPLGRGRGSAEMLVAHGLNYARANGYKVIPSCWFVSAYISANPEFQDLLA